MYPISAKPLHQQVPRQDESERRTLSRDRNAATQDARSPDDQFNDFRRSQLLANAGEIAIPSAPSRETASHSAPSDEDKLLLLSGAG